MIRQFILFSIVALLAWLGAACDGGEATEQRQRGPLRAEAVQAHPSDFSIAVKAVGDVLANEQVTIKAPVAGHIQAIHFQEGQQVRAGQPLVTLDSRAWNARKDGLEAQLASAKSDLDRKQGLTAVGGASQSEVEQLTARVAELKAQIAELEVTLDLAEMKAPFSGTVSMRNISPGSYLRQGEVVTELVQTQSLRVNFTLPARYRSQLHQGDSVQIIAPTRDDTAAARIYAIDPMIQQSSRSLQVRAQLANPEQQFMPGDFVQVLLELSTNQKALLIPAEAIIPELNRHVLYTIHQGKAVRQPVVIGQRTERQVQILEGLAPGDTVMVTGLLQVRAGQPVVVKQLKAEGAL